MERTANDISATFSLVALDPASGYFGSACASRAFAVGSLVPHLVRGVAAFNTQHCHHHRLAEQGLLLMHDGMDPQTAIRQVLEGDDAPETRQLLAVDAKGRKGAWTGDACTEVCHHVIGNTCVAAGNTLAGRPVVEAMAAYMDAHTEEPLGLRMIGALDAGQAEGGDRRGKQAAAIVTIPAALDVCESAYVDVRVDDSDDPLRELRRLYETRWQGKR